jgi:hypothetical protein
MMIEHINEPRLLFGHGEHICPRRGIFEYGVFDQKQLTRKKEIYIGGVGTSQCIDLLGSWIERCRSVIAAPSEIKQPNLRLPFCGFKENTGYKAKLIFATDLVKTIKTVDIGKVLRIEKRRSRLDHPIPHNSKIL